MSTQGFTQLKKALEDQVLYYLARQREALSWYELATQNVIETKMRLEEATKEIEKLKEYDKQLEEIEA